MICYFRVALCVSISASRHRSSLRLFFRVLTGCQLILLRVIVLIDFQLSLYYYALDLGPLSGNIVLSLGSTDLQPILCFGLFLSLMAVDFPCIDGANQVMLGTFIILVRNRGSLIEASDPF